MKNKNCPFCGGKVTKHPCPEHRKDYMIVKHTKDCFFLRGRHTDEEKLNFTLLRKGSRNWKSPDFEKWNNRNP